MGGTKRKPVARARSARGLGELARTAELPPADGSGVVSSGELDEARSTDQSILVAPRGVRTALRPTLTVLAGGSAGRIHRVEGDRTTIGRSKHADVTIVEHGVSRMHCAIVHGSGRSWYVEDLGSTNGTLVNGRRVERVELAVGDRVQLGPEVVLQFGFFDDAEEGLAIKLYEAATRDPLTRAHNRRYLNERLAAEVSYASRHADELACVMFDVDHFKQVNDALGHAFGDAALKEIAQIVSRALRTEDVFARYGGEEFVVLARGLTAKNAARLAERIRRAVADRRIVAAGAPEGGVRVTVSAGVATLSELPSPSPQALLDRADDRLYEAKQAGRNRVVAAAPATKPAS